MNRDGNNRGQSEGSRKTQFKPGQSGNPNGRPPKNISIPDLLREIGNEPVSEHENKAKLRMALDALYTKALRGDIKAIEFIANRTEGKSIQPVSSEAAESWYEMWERAGKPE